MRLYLSFSKRLFHNYVCQVVKGNDPILTSGGKNETKTKQMFYELLEVSIVRITEHMVSDLDSISTVKIRKGESLSAGLSMAFTNASEFADPELINANQVNQGRW